MKLVFYILIGGLGCYVLLAGLLYFFQEWLLFHPTKLAENHQFRVANAEEFYLEGTNSARLNALIVQPEQANPKGIILYFHGNAGSLEGWGQAASELSHFGYAVCVMDYRSYGKSTGKISQEALYQDGQLFYDYVKKSYPESQIVVYGRSLGTAIATKVASDNSPKQLILESPFHSMRALSRHYLPILPTKYLLRYPLPSVDYFSKITCPVMIIHGKQDKTVPYQSGKKLYESRKAEQTVHLVTISEGGHNDLDTYQQFWQTLAKTL